MSKCNHHWFIGTYSRANGSRYTKEKCKYCQNERYLVEDLRRLPMHRKRRIPHYITVAEYNRIMVSYGK